MHIDDQRLRTVVDAESAKHCRGKGLMAARNRARERMEQYADYAAPPSSTLAFRRRVRSERWDKVSLVPSRMFTCASSSMSFVERMALDTVVSQL